MNCKSIGPDCSPLTGILFEGGGVCLMFSVHNALANFQAASSLLSFLLSLHVDWEMQGSILWQPNHCAVLGGLPCHAVPAESASTGPSCDTTPSCS